jgi:SAM-dependent methyltransferase
VQDDWQIRAGELAGPAIESGEATAWFDRLYAAGAAGEVAMPWDRDDPQPLLRDWTRRERVRGKGKKAIVVGCGLGADAEYIASLGFDTIGFDISPTAVGVASERHPGSAVEYRVEDLLQLPEEWHHAFDLVVEVFTLQALPDPPRGDAARAVAGLVAPGGRLLAIAFRATPGDDPLSGPPFPLTRESIDAVATEGLAVGSAEELELDGQARWRVDYRR